MSIVQKLTRYFSTINRINFYNRQVIFCNRNFTTETTKYNNETLTELVKNDKVVIFMKGIPDAPKCGFSNAVVQVN